MSNDPFANLATFDPDAGVWHVVIETPKGSHNKYRYDERLGLFLLDGVLPEGMSFPYDFGFLPATLGEDGDPLDVLVLMDHPGFSGCLVRSRLVGVIEARQGDGKGGGGGGEAGAGSVGNDRLVAVPVNARVYNGCLSLTELNAHRQHEIEQFFVSYNRVRSRHFEVLGVHGPERAEALARAGMARHARRRAAAETPLP